MKKIISISLILFIFSCDSDSGGETFNCPLCPNDSLSSLIDLNESNNAVTCNYSEISNLGCVNVIEAEVNENDQTIIIYYNMDSNISGFQFDLNGITIDSVESYISNSFTISNSNSRIIGFSLTGDTIPDGCGVLLEINYSSPNGTPWNSPDFISDIVFSGDVLDSNIPNSLEVCGN